VCHSGQQDDYITHMSIYTRILTCVPFKDRWLTYSKMSLASLMEKLYGIDVDTFRHYVDDRAMKKVSDENAAFLSCMSRATETSIARGVQFSPLTVSTMTITGKFNTNGVEIPISRIRDVLFEQTTDDGLYLGVPKETKYRKTAFKETTDVRKFKHQVSFKLGTKSCKLFYNGTVHATGFSSLLDFLHTSVMISTFVEENAGIHMILGELDIKMINAGTTVQREHFPLTIPPRVLYSCAISMGYESYFDPERHPAVKLVLHENGQKVSTAFIFGTGSIVMCGCRNTSHITAMFDIVAQVLARVENSGSATSLRTTTVRKTFDISHGYMTSSYKLCAYLQ